MLSPPPKTPIVDFSENQTNSRISYEKPSYKFEGNPTRNEDAIQATA